MRHLDSGELVRTNVKPDGTWIRSRQGTNGSVAESSSDGTTVSASPVPDQRFGIQAPHYVTTLTTSGGITISASETADAILRDASDPFSVTTFTRRMTVNGRTTTQRFDAATRTVTVQTPAGRNATVTLDAKGRAVQIVEPGDLPVTLQYDAYGRLWSLTQGTRVVTVDYGDSGLVRSIVDPLGRMIELTHDSAGRVHSQTLPGGRTLVLDYDAAGNLAWVTPPGRPTHEFWFDPVDRVSTYRPPVVPGAGTSTEYGYDADGGLAQVLLPDESAIVPQYDDAGRLFAITSARGTTSVGYDEAGRVDGITAPDGGVVSYTFDGPLPMSETWAGTVSGSVARTYDNDLRVATQTVVGSTVAYQYDADGLLTSAGGLSISRDAQTGRIGTTSLGSVGTSQGYTSYGELKTYDATANGSNVYAYTLERDNAGRITSKTETVEGTTTTWGYAYDEAGRLWTVTRDGIGVASYEYDPNGNRLVRTAGGVTQSATYDDQDRLLADGAATYTYRPTGALESKTIGGQTTTYDYDANRNLLAAVLPDGRQIEYVVDGLNRRIGKKVNGVLVEGFLYDGQLRPAAWLDGAGQLRARFVYGLRVNVPEYMVTGEGTFRFLTDHLGSPRLVVSASTGAVVQRIDYDEWGQVLADSNPGFQPFGFAGGLYDGDTGLVRFGARDYDAAAGRWTAKDSAGFDGGVDLYSYCYDDPVDLVDSSGQYARVVVSGNSVTIHGSHHIFVATWNATRGYRRNLESDREDLDGSVWQMPRQDGRMRRA